MDGLAQALAEFGPLFAREPVGFLPGWEQDPDPLLGQAALLAEQGRG